MTRREAPRREGTPPEALVVFPDFDASSLGRKGFPIEVAWVFETGEEEAHLIRPAAGWTEWAASAEAVHRIPRDLLDREGTPAAEVARRALEALSGHRLYASAPSWDGQWLSRLLRAGGLPRHALRLRDTEEARAEAVAAAALEAAGVPLTERRRLSDAILGDAQRRAKGGEPAHRALDDARRERDAWLDTRRRAERASRAVGGAGGA